MIASEKMIESMNQQIGNEMGASMFYVGIASYFDGRSLPKLAEFFYLQSEEERVHAMKFQKFIVDAEGRLVIPAIPAPKCDFETAREAVALALDSEKAVTQQIYDLVAQATEDKSYIALRFLDWFVNEQFEEVTTMGGLLDVVGMVGEDGLLAVEGYLERREDPHAGGEG
ncbi:MAG: ferritin [Acidobacteria bacterium]|nr:ferritin [Acidobacteriota bacterium]